MVDRAEVERLVAEWLTGEYDDDFLKDLAAACGRGRSEREFAALHDLLVDVRHDIDMNVCTDVDEIIESHDPLDEGDTLLRYACDVLAGVERDYACDCVVAAGSQLKTEVLLHPSREMRLALAAEKVELRLLVRAIHWRAAAREAQRSCAQLLGAATALGICDRDRERVWSVADDLLHGGLEAIKVNVDLGPPDWMMYEGLPYDLSLWIRSVCFQLPSDPTDVEAARSTREGPMALFEPRLRALQRLFTSESESAAVIRRASELFFRAYQANETEFGVDRGEVIHRAVMCLEGLLLEPEQHSDVRARLAEAVAQRLGRSVEQRGDLRRLAKSAFDARSRYTHTGRHDVDDTLIQDTLSTARALLRRELESLGES